MSLLGQGWGVGLGIRMLRAPQWHMPTEGKQSCWGEQAGQQRGGGPQPAGQACCWSWDMAVSWGNLLRSQQAISLQAQREREPGRALERACLDKVPKKCSNLQVCSVRSEQDV